MRDSEKAGMNRIVLPLAGVIAALALVGLVLVICAKTGVFKVESAREIATVRPEFTAPPRENTVPPAQTPYAPSEAEVSGYCFLSMIGTGYSEGVELEHYKLGVSISNENDTEKGAVKVLSAFYRVYAEDDKLINSGILGELFTIQPLSAKMLETDLSFLKGMGELRAEVTVIWEDSEGREGTRIIRSDDRTGRY